MKMRRRIDVNLDELDQIIDRSTRAPLSASEGQQLKTALHAMAERLLPKRSTEKTNAVLPRDAAPAGQAENGAPAASGHGRHSAAAFRGAPKGWRQRTPHCNPAAFVRSAAVEKCTASKSRPRW
jgi:hypothetical protein